MTNESYAAIDLGSNSFHMLVANYNKGQLQIIDNIKEMVRLAAGLDQDGYLSDEAMATALIALQRCNQRIREIPRLNIRAVGTNTLRKAKNRQHFLDRAHAALGHPIEIISGREEARLIYLGVTNTVFKKDEQCLVIDIGGGSTEAIIGRGFDPLLLESLYVGCVNLTRKFFPDGEITAVRMQEAILHVRQELEFMVAIYRQTGWNTAIGSSGTILCINEILKDKGWSDHGISAAGLQSLKEYLIDSGRPAKFKLAPLPDKRKPVFAGGVAILCAIFESLVIDRMEVADGALREGLLHDLIDRRHDQDVRDQAIRALMERYDVDPEQAGRVLTTACDMFGQVRESWRLNPDTDLKLLQWASQVHELGLAVAHAQHHRHAGYLLAHSDLPGFSSQEQARLALLVRGHRRKLPATELQAETDPEFRGTLQQLCVLLRLAVLLNRSRSGTVLPSLDLVVKGRTVRLKFPPGWLQAHPLTEADLVTEKNYLKAVRFKLRCE